MYDLVLSNMTRNENSNAGAEFLDRIRNQSELLVAPVVFYVGMERPTPEGSFGLTTHADDLFRLIAEALEYEWA